jgi:hypothetical protein
LGKKITKDMSNGKETSYDVYVDCYQNDDKTYTCVSCHEKNKNDNPVERERERESKFELGLPN